MTIRTVQTALAVALAASAMGCGRFRFDALPDGASDAASDAAIDAQPTVYRSLTDPLAWSTFDLLAVDPGAKGYVGGAFDGRYVYLAPYNNGGYSGLVVRYDTQATFASAASWTLFNVATINPNARGYAGVVFDGRYLFFVPNDNTVDSGVFARYDTQSPFTVAASWKIFDATTTNTLRKGFQGGCFDGRFAYFAPWHSTNGYDGLVTRLDTTGTMDSPASWSSFDTTSVNAKAAGMFGAVCDGRAVYLVPAYDGTAFDGTVVRYDPAALFTSAGSWQTFDATTLSAAAVGYSGAVTDGRYSYFVPSYSGGTVLRYDAQASFTAAASWTTFDTTTLVAGAKGFFGGGFDGRYVYFSPSNNGAADGITVRVDTQASFTDPASWSEMDVATIAPAATGFHGTVFDGRYLYFVPSSGSTIARFDAKTPASLPASYRGSFF